MVLVKILRNESTTANIKSFFFECFVYGWLEGLSIVLFSLQKWLQTSFTLKKSNHSEQTVSRYRTKLKDFICMYSGRRTKQAGNIQIVYLQKNAIEWQLEICFED